MQGSSERDFTLRHDDERSEFSGNTPRHAALKAARRLDPINDRFTAEDEARDHACEIRLREKGSDKVHVYAAWAWEDQAPDTRPSWMGDTITKANVSKKGIEFE